MLVTNHVLAGAAIGAVLRRRPVAAFAAGLASHLIMDSLPHWGLPGEVQTAERFLRVARRDGTIGLAALLALSTGAGGARRAVLAGMAGATLLDVDKPAKHFLGRNPVPGPVQRFHERIQRESPRRMPGEFLAGVALLGLSSALIRRSKSR
jgi:hypothetical protein